MGWLTIILDVVIVEIVAYDSRRTIAGKIVAHDYGRTIVGKIVAYDYGRTIFRVRSWAYDRGLG